jgi:sn-glycerol 3-phosphate transport system substrate-binding protein
MPKVSSTVLRSILAALLVVFAAGSIANAQTEIRMWYALTGPLAEHTLEQIDDFNASQDQYRVVADFSGNYDETMVAAIAAFRAGTAPHIVQMFEVGTATMMYAGGAIKPVHELFAETGVPFDPDIYLPAVKGYYSLPDGSMMSMPFNSSTAVMWVNDDALTAAGIDPATVELETWEQVREVAKQVVDNGGASCGFSHAWPTWTQFEQFSAIHDVPLASEMNGLAGLGAELMVNSDLHVAHVQNLIDMAAEGSYMYGGRGNAGDTLFVSGECAIVQGSSALIARVNREAEFDWTMHMLPYYEGTPNAPLNSIIGGASFWVMQSPARTAEEWQGVAEFFSFLSTVEQARKWHVNTGYLPIRFGIYEELEAEGFYAENPGVDIPYLQLTRGEATANSSGLRLGNMPQIRAIIEEELELALNGQQSAQRAMDNAVERANVVLRAFQRANQ